MGGHRRNREPACARSHTSSGTNAEVEIVERTEVFGNVAHRLSTYTKRSTVDGEAIEGAGVISTQLIRTPAGWKISSMAWDDERPGLDIPERYR